jgi:hypothetical protein
LPTKELLSTDYNTSSSHMHHIIMLIKIFLLKMLTDAAIILCSNWNNAKPKQEHVNLEEYVVL